MRWTAALIAPAVLLMAAGATAGTTRPSEPNIVSDTCSQCHGDHGISPNPWFPNLAAQTKTYLETDLKDLRDHKRADQKARAYMWSIAGPLSDKKIDKVAEYFSSLPPPKGSSDQDPPEVASGKTIFKNGIASENVPACGMCHGATAAGTSMAPRLAGQHRGYLMAQLKAFRSNARQNPIMHANVKDMTDKQMRDISAYLAAL